MLSWCIKTKYTYKLKSFQIGTYKCMSVFVCAYGFFCRSLVGCDVENMMFILFSVDGYKITYQNLNQTLIFVKDSIISTHVLQHLYVGVRKQEWKEMEMAEEVKEEEKMGSIQLSTATNWTEMLMHTQERQMMQPNQMVACSIYYYAVPQCCCWQQQTKPTNTLHR